jgi:ketosteroid isomerase-like protein
LGQNKSNLLSNKKKSRLGSKSSRDYPSVKQGIHKLNHLTMKPTTLQVYHKFRTAMLSGTDSWTELIAEGIYLKGPLAEAKGKDNFIAINKPFFASIQSSEPTKVVRSGQTVITQIVTVIKLPDGSDLALEVSEWYDIADGKIQSLVVYFDTHALRNAWGL